MEPVTSSTDWKITPNVDSPFTTCGAIGTMFGGSGKFGETTLEKTFNLNGPSSHWAVIFQITIIKIDSWDIGSDYLQLFLNDVLMDKFVYKFDDGEPNCGRNDFNFWEKAFDVNKEISSTSPTLYVKLYGKFDESTSDESWGIRNIMIYLRLCDTECETCYGASNTNCLSCFSGYFLNPGKDCKTNCPTDYYYTDTSNRACKKCHIYCKRCKASTNYDCTDCEMGYFLQYSSTTCLNTCPTSGYYPYTTDRTCKPCNQACAVCTGSSASQCSSCTKNYYLQPFASSCLTTCPPGYFTNPNGNVCTVCHNSCATCSDGTDTTCLTCKSPNFLQPSVNSCLNSCPLSGYFPNKSNLRCTACNHACLVCSGSTENECSSCANGFYFQPVLNPTSCLATCPDGSYRKNIVNVCETCEISCTLCTGPTNEECSSCSSTYFLQPTKTQCFTTCPGSLYFPNKITNKCDRCHDNCLICTGGLNSECSMCAYNNAPGCSNCTINYFLQPLPQPTTCLETCPKGYYKNNLLYKCQACAFECSDCFGALSSECNECKTNYFLQPKPLNTVCGSICPEGWFGNGNSQSCSVCVSPCKLCESAKNCVNCVDTYFFYLPDKSCLLECPNGYFKNFKTSSCIKCYVTCLTCTDDGPNYCNDCKENYILDVNTCRDKCPDGKYKNTDPLSCLACVTPCVTCEGPLSSQCFTCVSGYFLNPLPNDKLCSLTCPPKFYGRKSLNKCIPCINNCQECETPSGLCKTCLPSYFFHSGTKACNFGCPEGSFGNITTFLCVDHCEQGEYANSLRVCNKCDGTCLSCELFGTGSECTKCYQGRFLYLKECRLTCPEGYFNEGENQVCETCSRNCKICTSATECTECHEDYYVSQRDYRCIRCDQPSEIKEDLKCVECVRDCEICASKGVCLKCKEGFFLRTKDNCVQIRTISPVLIFADFQTWIFLDFSSETQEFVNVISKDVSNYVSANISGISSFDYSFSGAKNSSTRLQFLFDFRVRVEKGTILSLSIRKEDWMVTNIEEMLGVFEYNITFISSMELCTRGTYRNPMTGNCEGTNIITPELKTTTDPTKVTLAFDQPYPELFDMLTRLTRVEIEGVESADFEYEFYQISDLNFEILILHLKINHIPFMIVSFFLPFNISTNSKMQLSTTFVALSLWNFVDLESPEMQEVAKTAPAVKSGDILTKLTTSLATVFFSTALTLRGGMAAESIKFLRYLKLDFPGNCIKIFENQNEEEIKWIPNLKLTKDQRDPTPTEKFGAYGVHPYLLNNLFPYIVRIIGVTILSILVSKMGLRRDVLKRKLMLRCIKYYLFTSFVWSMPIATCIYTYPFFALYTFIAFRWYSLGSSLGILNFSFAIASVLYLFLLQKFLLNRLSLFKKELNKSKKEEKHDLIRRMRGTLAEIFGMQHLRRAKDHINKRFHKMIQRKLIKRKKHEKPEKPEEISAVELIKVSPPEINLDTLQPPPESDKLFIDNLSKVDQSLGGKEAGLNIKEGTKEELKEELKEGANGELKEEGKEEEKEVHPPEIILNFEITATSNKNNESNNSPEKTQGPGMQFSSVKRAKMNKKYLEENKHLLYFDYSGIDKLMQEYRVIHSDLTLIGVNVSCFFPLFDMNRHLINAIVIVFLSNSTLMQTSIICSTNAFVLLFIIFLRPFKRRKIMVLSIVNEILLNIISACTCYIHILDKKGDHDLEKRFLIGRIILYTNMILLFLSSFLFFVDLCFLILSFLKSLKFYYREYKELRREALARKKDPLCEDRI